MAYLEEQAMYDGMQPGFDCSIPKSQFSSSGVGRGMGLQSIREYIRRQLPLQTCPSDPSTVPTADKFPWPAEEEVAVTSYKGVAGDTALGANFFDGLWNDEDFGTKPDCFEGLGCNGLFWKMGYYEKLSFKRISDGLSGTLMLGETVMSQDPPSSSCHS